MELSFYKFKDTTFDLEHPIGQHKISLISQDPHIALNVELPQKLANCSELVLHASSVIIQNKIFAFSGLSGTGKSTLAYDLTRKGFQLYSDEALILKRKNNSIICYSYPQEIRIWKNDSKVSVQHSSDSEALELAHLFLLHEKDPMPNGLELFLESTYRPNKRNSQLDLRLMDSLELMSQNKLVSVRRYSKNPESIQSLQRSINSLL